MYTRKNKKKNPKSQLSFKNQAKIKGIKFSIKYSDTVSVNCNSNVTVAMLVNVIVYVHADTIIDAISSSNVHQASSPIIFCFLCDF